MVVAGAISGRREQLAQYVRAHLGEGSIVEIVRRVIGDQVDVRLNNARRRVLARPRVRANLANRGAL